MGRSGVSGSHERSRNPWQRTKRNQDMDQITVAHLGVKRAG